MTPRGTITFTFDDGYEAVYQNALPLLERYNFKGVFAIPLNYQKVEQTEGAKVRPWPDWLPIRERGHEIAAHSVNHVNFTKLSPPELNQELQEPKNKLGAATLVYPGGAFNDAVIEAAEKYYSAARTVVRGLEGIPTANGMQLKSFNWTRNNFSPAKANLLALWAYCTNSWLIETFHMIDDHDTKLVHSVKTTDLDKHLKFVSKLPVYVRTIQEVISSHNH